MTNEQLLLEAEDSFVTYALVSLVHLRAWAALEPIPTRGSVAVVFSEQPGQWADDVRIVPDYALFIRTHWKALSHLPGASACVRTHQAAGFVASWIGGFQHVSYAQLPGTLRQDQTDEGFLQSLQQPLLACLNHYASLELTPDQIKAVYGPLRDSWLSATVRWKMTVPLLGVVSDCSQDVTISPNLQLGPLTPHEKSALWNTLGHWSWITGGDLPSLSPGTLSHTGYRLAGVEVTDKRHQLVGPDLRAEVIDVVRAMRLLKGGSCGAPYGYLRAEPDDLTSGGRGQAFPVTIPAGASPPTFSLNMTDIADIQLIVTSLEATGAKDKLAVALRRFDQAYERRVLEDRLIDLAIILEVLLGGGERGELTYKIAMRGAVAAASMHMPTESRKFLNRLYDVRSKIVHEGKKLSELPATGPSPDEYIQECEQFVRDILRSFTDRLGQQQRADNAARAEGEKVSSDPPIRRIIQTLDAAMLNGLGWSDPPAD